MKSQLRHLNQRFPTPMLTVLLLFLSGVSFAQRPCVITGKIIDKANGDALIGAIVQLDSTAFGTVTDIDGHYRLMADPGRYVLSVKYFGYETAMIEVDLKSGDVTNLEYAMSEAEALALQEVIVVGNAVRSSEVVLNIELKKASYIASGISAAEIRRTPDRTVGDILRRVTGASIQDGKFVIIRGMNDRYNAGYLDGALLSSTESDRKAFAFDVIPASLIDNLIIIKSGSPDLTGDFGGGVIKINTKSVPDKLVQNISLGAQFHSLTTNKPFQDIKTYSGENLNFISDQRYIPDFEDGALRLKSNFPTAQEKQDLAAISKNFNHEWSGVAGNATPNTRLGYSIGIPFPVGENGNFGMILALNYANTRRISDREINTYDGAGQVAGFHDKSYSRNLNTGGILNLNYVTPKTLLSFHNLVNITTDFNTVRRTGVGNYNDALMVQNTAMIINYNRLYNGILSYKQLIRDSLMTIEISGSYGNVLRDVPDYRIANYTSSPDFPQYQLALGDFFNSSSGRFTSQVNENLYTGTFEVSKKFRGNTIRTELKAGYFYQYRDREFSGRSFVFKGAPNDLTLDPALDLGESNIDGARLYLVEKTSDDLSYYQGKTETHAGFLLANQKFGPNLKAVYGVRLEAFALDVFNQKTDQDVARINETSLLPSANLTYSLSDKTNLRFSYFASVNRPEFRELAPFSFFVFDKNAEIRGERHLQIAKLNNLDIRYEFYPDGGQLISIGGFYKHITDPIELSLDVTQPFTTFTYQNEMSADIYGVELELKKKLDFIGGGVFQNMGLYSNLSLIKSSLRFKEGSQAKDDRPLQGQSPYIINLRLQYENPDLGWAASASLNRVGRRIAFVGVDPSFGDTRQDIYEDPRTVLDLQVGKTIGPLNIKLTIGDVFHQDLIYYQDTNQDGTYSSTSGDRLMYINNTGFTTNLGLNYSF